MGMVSKLTFPLAATVTMALFTAPALAGEVKIYPYETQENYCPSGLQPVVVIGEISCGVPNQIQSYQQIMRHPAQRRAYHRNTRRYSAHPNCVEGSKGCS